MRACVRVFSSRALLVVLSNPERVSQGVLGAGREVTSSFSLVGFERISINCRPSVFLLAPALGSAGRSFFSLAFGRCFFVFLAYGSGSWRAGSRARVPLGQRWRVRRQTALMSASRSILARLHTRTGMAVLRAQPRTLPFGSQSLFMIHSASITPTSTPRTSERGSLQQRLLKFVRVSLSSLLLVAPRAAYSIVCKQLKASMASTSQMDKVHIHITVVEFIRRVLVVYFLVHGEAGMLRTGLDFCKFMPRGDERPEACQSGVWPWLAHNISGMDAFVFASVAA